MLLGLSLALTALAAAQPAQPARRSPTLGLMYADLARDLGLRAGRQLTPADVLAVQTLLEAAARLDPDNPRPLVWLYDLATRQGQTGRAAELIERIVTLRPDSTAALARWLEVGPPDLQTVEQQCAWLNGLLERQRRPECQALIHTRLAQLELEQADRSDAEQHLNRAAQLWPDCPSAALLRIELLSAGDPPARRLAVLLDALRLHPLGADLAWQVGLVLDEVGLPGEAREFYDYAWAVEKKITGGQQPTAERMLQYARNCLACGDEEQALNYAQRAAWLERRQRGTYEAAFFWYWLARQRNVEAEVLDQIRAPLARQFAAIKEPQRWPLALVAQAAWYYCTIDQQPQRALALARAAAQQAPDDPFVRRVLGWASYISGQVDAARQTLAPLAADDPCAAALLATILSEQGDSGAAGRLWSQLKCAPQPGLACDLFAELGIDLTSQPATRGAAVAEVLAAFDRRVLDFYEHPESYLAASIAFERPSMSTADRWWLVITLTNRAPFAITLGADQMVNPVLLLSFQLEAEEHYRFPNLLPITLDRELLLAPGQTLKQRVTVDIGPPRSVARRTPQHLLSIAVSAILDPRLDGQGRWSAGPCGQLVRPTLAARVPAVVEPASWAARFAALRDGKLAQRCAALSELGQLLGEYQRARLGKLTYRPEPIPAADVVKALRRALEARDWRTRVAALEAWQLAGIDRTTLRAVEKCLDDPHWAVRLSAVRLLARQGKTWSEVAQRVATSDADELVRNMARSYLLRWQGAAEDASSR